MMFKQTLIEKDSDNSENNPCLTHSWIGVGVKVKIETPVRIVVQKSG